MLFYSSLQSLARFSLAPLLQFFRTTKCCCSRKEGQCVNSESKPTVHSLIPFVLLGSGPDRGRCPVEHRGEIPSVRTYVRPPLGLTQPLGGLTQPSGSLTQPSGGLTQPSRGLTQPSTGLTQPSAGLTQPSGGLTQPSGGLTQPSGGLTQP